MSNRPRRSTANQKDAKNDMLGLSREEERMVQRAMYDSLRQQNKIKLKLLKKSRLLKNSMTTRSMATTKLTISVPDNLLEVPPERVSQEECSRSADEIKTEQEIKRGTRYSPMRKGPLSEMLKSLEHKKTQFKSVPMSVSVKQTEKRTVLPSKKGDAVVREAEIKSSKTVGEAGSPKKRGRTKVNKDDKKCPRLSTVKQKSSCGLMSKTPSSARKTASQRTARSASLAARSYWLSQVSDTSSLSKYKVKISTPVSSSSPEPKAAKSYSDQDAKLCKLPLIYNKKEMSTSQRMSRNILAAAAKRIKKAKLKIDKAENKRRYNSKMRSTKEAEIQNRLVIPPELWLDPKGQPVDTQDFINFLLFRDTPYLDSSLKWFHLPPHRRKQRFYKVIQSEPGMKFNETVVYTEKKEGGGKEVIVHCIPPKLIDDGSEPMSTTSEQSSTPEENKFKLSASANSSCHTLAAVDEESSRNVCVVKEVDCASGRSPQGPGRPKTISTRPSPTYEYRSKHIMNTRNRGP